MHVTNDAFLRAVFGAEWEDAHVCAFDCDPAGAGVLWAGTKWRHMGAFARAQMPTQNSYFTISLFDDDAAGHARRRKDLFRATCALVLDDVGTKAKRDAAVARLPSPSWRLETSPGNEQWGFVLRPSVTDRGQVDALLDALVKDGLVDEGKDPGMKGVTRYARLPEGVNTKAHLGAGGFRCRMLEWAF